MLLATTTTTMMTRWSFQAHPGTPPSIIMWGGVSQVARETHIISKSSFLTCWEEDSRRYLCCTYYILHTTYYILKVDFFLYIFHLMLNIFIYKSSFILFFHLKNLFYSINSGILYLWNLFFFYFFIFTIKNNKKKFRVFFTFIYLV